MSPGLRSVIPDVLVLTAAWLAVSPVSAADSANEAHAVPFIEVAKSELPDRDWAHKVCQLAAASCSASSQHNHMADRFKRAFIIFGIALICAICMACSGTRSKNSYSPHVFLFERYVSTVTCPIPIFYPGYELGVLFTCQYLEYRIKVGRAFNSSIHNGAQDLGGHDFSHDFYVESDAKPPHARDIRPRFVVNF